MRGGDRLRLGVPATLREERTTRDATTEMDPPLCEHHRNEWRMEVAPVGLDHLGRRQFRTRVVHTYEVPGRMFYTYGGEPYVQHGVDLAHAGQPSLGDFLPPGAPPPTRYRSKSRSSSGSSCSRSRKCSVGLLHRLPDSAPLSGQLGNARERHGRPGPLRAGPPVSPMETEEPR